MPAPVFFSRHKGNLIYGILMALLLFILKWLEMRFIIFDHAFEVYTAAIAVIFTTLGIWLAVKLSGKGKQQTIIVEKHILVSDTGPFQENEEAISRLGLSKREMEVLNLMAAGLSNPEIAEKLFVSQNTIKTHSSNIFLKLEVNRRIQAIEKARKMNLIR